MNDTVKMRLLTDPNKLGWHEVICSRCLQKFEIPGVVQTVMCPYCQITGPLIRLLENEKEK